MSAEVEMVDSTFVPSVGQQIGGLSMFSNAFKRGYGSAVFGSDHNGIWLGAADWADAPFRVNMSGNAVLNSLIANGYTKGFVSTLVWSATDIDTAAWTTGTIKVSDGTVYTIASGNTGNITVDTYLYLDPAVSTTVLQSTTTANNSVGNNRNLIAIVRKGATGETCSIQVMSSMGTVISGESITTPSLSAISATLGSVNVGGSGNGNGVISVKDSSDVEKVLLNNDGITVSGGKVTIKDDSETTTIDSKGIVGSALTLYGSSSSGSINQHFTTSSEVDVTGSEINFTVARQSTVLILVKATIYHGNVSTNKANLTIRFRAQGNEFERLTMGGNVSPYDGNLRTLHTHFYSTISAGDKAFKLTGQLESITGSPDMVLLDFRLSYIILGK